MPYIAWNIACAVACILPQASCDFPEDTLQAANMDAGTCPSGKWDARVEHDATRGALAPTLAYSFEACAAACNTVRLGAKGRCMKKEA